MNPTQFDVIRSYINNITSLLERIAISLESNNNKTKEEIYNKVKEALDGE